MLSEETTPKDGMPVADHTFFDKVKRAANEALRTSAYFSYAIANGIWEKPQIVLVLGHMRAGSTLLTHILASHPEILGYGETHLHYKSPLSFHTVAGKIRFVTREHLDSPSPQALYLDKSLHNYQLTVDNIPMLTAENVKIIFLLRQPVGTLSSLMRTFGIAQDEAADYYTQRLPRLADYAQALAPHGKESLFIQFEDLVHNTEDTLGRLSQFLGLSTPLKAEYDTRLVTATGKKGGDPSDNILAGRILKKRPAKQPSISRGLLAQAEQVFARTQLTLRHTSQAN